MPEPKLELKATGLDPIGGNFAHLFVVYTDSDGQQWIARGGLEQLTLQIFAQIAVVTKGVKETGTKDDESVDTPVATLLAQGADAVSGWNAISQHMSAMNAPTIYYRHDQNSNSAIAGALQFAGFTDVALPQGITPADVPGWGYPINIHNPLRTTPMWTEDLQVWGDGRSRIGPFDPSRIGETGFGTILNPHEIDPAIKSQYQPGDQQFRWPDTLAEALDEPGASLESVEFSEETLSISIGTDAGAVSFEIFETCDWNWTDDRGVHYQYFASGGDADPEAIVTDADGIQEVRYWNDTGEVFEPDPADPLNPIKVADVAYDGALAHRAYLDGHREIHDARDGVVLYENPALGWFTLTRQQYQD
ncbi:MAG: hypothetical protein ACREB6_03495, partial [Rhodospirillales bacterium]